MEKTFDIQLNEKGSKHMQVSETSLQTIEQYGLFKNLTGSTGIVDEQVLNKLKLTIRSLIAHHEGDCKNLLDLCIDVVYHEHMKAYGLKNLISVYDEWEAAKAVAPEENNEA